MASQKTRFLTQPFSACLHLRCGDSCVKTETRRIPLLRVYLTSVRSVSWQIMISPFMMRRELTH